MELGEKLRLARMEAGLSQRQLCGDVITRNMLSQIENGSAKPSMKTLAYLAGGLGKSVSYFLEETAVVSPNQDVMNSARRLYDAREYAEAALVLEAYTAPDPVYDREKQLIWCLIHLALAEQALDENRERYARELLEKANAKTVYCSAELNRRRLLLLGRVPGNCVSAQLPSLDEELLLRAQDALQAGNFQRAAAFLEAVEDTEAPRWNLLRGRAYMAAGNWSDAVRCLHAVEAAYPAETNPLLEICFRELGDFQQAYAYACKQR